MATKRKSKTVTVHNPEIYLDEDTRLMLQAADGNAQAFAKLYRKYIPIVTSYLASLNAHQNLLESLTQEVFVRIWHHRKRYHPSSTIKTYLFGYANKVLAEERKRFRKELTVTHKWFLKRHANSFDVSSGPEPKVLRAELAKTVRHAISELTNKQKQAVKIFYILGCSVDEAAERANCSTKAFESRLSRARQRLRQLLDFSVKP